jgi:hypothetical protein
MVDNLHGNARIYNKVIGGDKYSLGDISNSSGLAIGQKSAAPQNSTSSRKAALKPG